MAKICVETNDKYEVWVPPNLVYHPHSPLFTFMTIIFDNNDNNDNNNNDSTLKAGATEPGLLRDDAVQTRQRAPR